LEWYQIDVLTTLWKEMLVRVALVAVALSLAFPCWSRAATIHVPADQPTIQAGIEASVYGDTVLVACGTYYEHDLLLHDGLAVLGVSGSPTCVVIDAQQQGRVFSLSGASEAGVLVEGLTLTGAEGPDGGAFRIENSTVAIRACRVTGNIVHGGGNPHGGGGEIVDSSVIIEDTVFEDNTALIGTPRYGGGLFMRRCDATLTNVAFRRNTAHRGGGLFISDGDVLLVRCSIALNTTEAWGGDTDGPGMYVQHGAIVGVEQSTIALNTSGTPGAGAIRISAGSGDVLQINESVIAANLGCAALSLDAVGGVTTSCSDVFGNAEGDWIGALAGQDTLNGNIFEDPLFCDPESGDFALAADSPCLPVFNSCGVLMGAFGEGCGPVATETTSWSQVKSLF